LSPRGKPLTQGKISELSKKDGMTIICGRYEGIDQRISDYYKVEECSIGDFILAGGEVAAQAIIESTVRLLPKTLGHEDSSKEETFNNSLLEFPQYTRPKVWNKLPIPEVLISGNHKKIADWRTEMAEKLTKKIRPDLWKNYKKSKTTKK
jgi:tRNA (guanine37-N1)-methyltransferase